MNKASIPTLTNRDAWSAAFPMDEATRAVEFLVKTWQEVVPAKREFFNATQRENVHTEKFWFYLQSLSLSKGRLTGQWSYEHPEVFMEDATALTPVLNKRIRKDITYFSNRNDDQLLLIFEFKKLRATKDSWKTYHGTEGMRRFVDGHYAIGRPLAFMVGMIIGDRLECIAGLRRSILSPGTLSDLRMISRSGGQYIFDPSLHFPQTAEFDTEHNRPASKAAKHGTILLSHLFLDMPS